MNQDVATTAARIQDLLRDQLLIEIDSPEEDLLASGVLDSLTLVQLLLGIEERFGVKIALSDLGLEDIRSVASIAALITNKYAHARAGTAA
jgi:acyl carrier protein